MTFSLISAGRMIIRKIIVCVCVGGGGGGGEGRGQLR